MTWVWDTAPPSSWEKAKPRLGIHSTTITRDKHVFLMCLHVPRTFLYEQFFSISKVFFPPLPRSICCFEFLFPSNLYRPSLGKVVAYSATFTTISVAEAVRFWPAPGIFSPAPAPAHIKSRLWFFELVQFFLKQYGTYPTVYLLPNSKKFI